MGQSTKPYFCFLPPHIVDRLAESPDSETRRKAIEHKEIAAAARAVRTLSAGRRAYSAAAPPGPAVKKRSVYDMQQRRVPVPGQLRRSEHQVANAGDAAVDEAFDFAGVTYDFYEQILSRNSLDNMGMELVSSVHYGRQIPNAFWNGEQMLYGDGDGQLFDRFTKAIDVVAHELTHGVIQHTANLEYENEPGALNEHFADAMSACVKQKYLGQDVKNADWLLGDALMLPRAGIQSLRTFKAQKAYENHPVLGTDPQPKHIRNKYTGEDDYGGVHINSGIPNHAFYLAAMRIGGNSWDPLGKIWYRALLTLSQFSNFHEAATATIAAAGQGTIEQQAITEAWKSVGIQV